MFITTKVVLDIHTGKILEQEGYEYFGPVAYCKGDNAVRNAENSTASFQQTLMNAFRSQFATQTGTLNFLNGKLTNEINNPTGFDPKTLAAMNSGAINTTAAQFQNAEKTAQAQSAANGGNGGLPSGVQAQIQGQLTGATANETSNLLNQNQIQNGLLQNQNFWNSIDRLSGVASQENPLGYSSGALTAGGDIANLSEAYKNSQQSQLLGALGGIVGGGASAFGAYEAAH